MTGSRQKRQFQTPEPATKVESLLIMQDGESDVVVQVSSRDGLKSPRVKGLAHKNSMWEGVARAYQKIAEGKAPNKYLDALRWLAKYLVFLDGKYLTLQDVDRQFFTDYVKFLRDTELGLTTRYNYYTDVGTLIKNADLLAGLGSDRVIPAANHGETSIPTKKTSKLSQADLISIAAAALTECMKTMRDYANARLILTLKKMAHPDKKAHFHRTLSEQLFLISQRFDILFKKNGTALCLKELRSLFFPTVRKTVPFIILLSVYTAYNPDTAKKIKYSDITLRDNKSRDPAEGGTMIIRATKNRAKARQTVSFPITEDPGNPYILLEFQKIWRSSVSELIADEDEDYCFLYVPSSEKKVKNFHEKGTSAFAVHKFAKENSLPDFQLDDIRQAVLDLGGHLFGGDLLALQKIAGHASIATTHSNYSSTTLIAIANEKFAVYLSMRERWMESFGKVDPRDQHGMAEVLSATPGFICLDPHDSPIPGERAGKLCKAYGACPDCPLSAVRTDSPISYLRLLQLKKLIQEAKTELSPSRWLSVWQARLLALDRWLACFPSSVVEFASQLVEPGPLPPLE
ncbi:phage integrase SAM-like domain-containing protein [Pseudomonas costantinii]|uniref:phage integrase SAM-like domain-containing protein n=1 Tax=Pseudomonas costantinii TaxID=168469 RepID=UPI0015A47D24|nr:phage integrase SAM-like domain-containing protein [Pseudomonas costantinii]NVZ69080.1 phage integrase SAM-like domain-containing protein [Pseudomonas costantinii]